MKKSHRQGFTLVELLIVVSIIALLIGILLPALGEARRSARLVVDIANLREHGNGAQAYAAENKGALPNTKRFYHGSGGIGSSKPKLWPGWQYAGPFNSEKSPFGPSNGIGFNQGVAHGALWKFFSPAFGDYIIDAQGIDLLTAEIFTSPGSTERSNHGIIARDAKAFPGGSRSYLQDESEWNMSANATGTGLAKPYLDDRGDSSTWALSGTYRYTVSAIVGQSSVNDGGALAGTNFFTGVNANNPTGKRGGETPWAQPGIIWTAWRAYVKGTTFAHPTNKVLFWDLDVANSPTDFYTKRGAKVAVNMVDGSTTTVTPYDEIPYLDDVEQAFFQYGEYVGTREVYQRQYAFVRSDDAQREGGFTRGAPAWFAMTQLGPKGRDLGGKAYIGISNR